MKESGNLYTNKSPAAMNSSVAHEKKDVNGVNHWAYAGCNVAMFFEFSLFNNLCAWLEDHEMMIVDNGAHWA